MREAPTSIRLTKEQRVFLRRVARAQKHNKLTTVIKRFIDREMEGKAS